MSDSTRRPTRRDFLRGKALLEAVRGAVNEAIGSGATGAEPELELLRVSRYAMGTTFSICMPAAAGGAVDVATAALDLIEELENRLTVYHDRSEVARVNRAAAGQAVPVSAELYELLEQSLALYRQTDGAFDVAIGSVIHAWGFVHGPRRVPDAGELADAMSRSGSRWVALDRERRTVRFLKDGVQLNFGSIGKGYALDRAAWRIRTLAGELPVLLQGGASSVLAVGSPAADGWRVGIANPLDPKRRLVTVSLRNEALGTASNLIRFVDDRGRRYGHVLDPRTGWPAEGLLQASVIAPDAATADALATALLVMGREAAEAFCARHPELSAILVWSDGEVTTGSERLELCALGPVSRESLDFNC